MRLEAKWSFLPSNQSHDLQFGNCQLHWVSSLALAGDRQHYSLGIAWVNLLPCEQWLPPHLCWTWMPTSEYKHGARLSWGAGLCRDPLSPASQQPCPDHMFIIEPTWQWTNTSLYWNIFLKLCKELSKKSVSNGTYSPFQTSLSLIFINPLLWSWKEKKGYKGKIALHGVGSCASSHPFHIYKWLHQMHLPTECSHTHTGSAALVPLGVS